MYHKVSCHNIFTVWALQVMSYIVYFIHSAIVVNSEAIVFVLFDWEQFYYDATHSIFVMHSHSYFNTHLKYIYFKILSHSYYNFNLDATRLFFETIFIIIMASQVLIFIRIQYFLIIDVIYYNGCLYNIVIVITIVLFVHCRS